MDMASSYCCCCVRHAKDDRTNGLLNLGSCICAPEYVRKTIFICGYKDTTFPLHCMVGPDWAVMAATSLSIIVPSVLFLIYISENISRYMTIADGIVLILIVVSHWITACSDPGTVYCLDQNLYDESPRQEMVPVDNTPLPQENLTESVENSILQEVQTADLEAGARSSVAAVGTNTDTGTGTETGDLLDNANNGASPLQTSPPVRMECNICAITRPSTAKHCYSCDTCVDHLDHHCPFTGKCIGRKNLYPFLVFVNLIGVHCYFVIGTTLYYVIARVIIPAV